MASTLRTPTPCPTMGSTSLVQPVDVLDTMSLGDDFDFLDLPNDLEVHTCILPFLAISSGITLRLAAGALACPYFHVAHSLDSKRKGQKCKRDRRLQRLVG